MLDYRINTFITLYNEMNYRKTAEKLNMTQPGVTQHIHYLEGYYGVKLFEYNGRSLSKTENAEMLKTGTVETAKESERGVVDIETLKQTNETLISTLDEVLRIQDEGRQKRREAESELARIEGELKQKLLTVRS